MLLTAGGCGHFWHIKCNLATRQVYGLEVNESGDIHYLPRKKKPAPRISRPKSYDKRQKVRITGYRNGQPVTK